MAQLPLYYKNSKPTGPPPSKKWKEYYLIGILFVAFIILIAGVLSPSYIVDNSKLEGGGKEESGEKGKSKKEEEGDPALDTLV